MMLTLAFIKTLLLPPGLQILSILFGLILWYIHRRLAKYCLWFGFLSLWLLATPAISSQLIRALESPFEAYTSNEAPTDIEAIVVLGGGSHHAPEYEGDTVSHSTLWRLRYGAYLANRWKLPVIVSGGSVFDPNRPSEAELGAKVLSEELGVYPVWQEGNSRNTWENAQMTQGLLRDKGISKIALVTHGYHMRRAVFAFKQAGIEHIPMPTGLASTAKINASWLDWLPTSGALNQSRTALHEYMGLVFYGLKNRSINPVVK